MLVRSFSFVIVLVLLLPMQALPANNERPEQNNLVPSSSRQGPEVEPRITRREASELVSEEYEGRILSIRQERDQWRVRMDSDGTVFNIFVDTRTGDISRKAD